MKIAIVAPSAIPSRRANSIQSMKMAQALVNLGHAVRLAAPGSSKSVPGNAQPPTPGVDWQSLAHHYGLAGEPGLSSPPFTIEWLPSADALRRYDFGLRAVNWARRWPADLLYTRLPQAAAVSSRLGLPTILEVHDLPHGAAGPRLFRAFLRGKGVRGLVAITHALAEDLSDLFGAPRPSTAEPPVPSCWPVTIVAPDGVDLSRYKDLPAPQIARRRLAEKSQEGQPDYIVGGMPERFTVGYTGHLYAGRGVQTILALAGRLPEMNFLLVGGEPSEVVQLSGEVKTQGLANVYIAGFVPNAELPLYQAACEVLLMPYQKQVAASSGGDIARYLSPMKVFEYLATGRAILSSALPVLSEVLTPQNAVLLPPEDLAAWENALLQLRQDPAERDRLGEQARKDAARYTWEARARSILEGCQVGRAEIALQIPSTDPDGNSPPANHFNPPDRNP